MSDRPDYISVNITADASNMEAGMQRATVSARDFAAALEAAGGDVRKINPDMIGLGNAAEAAGKGLKGASDAAKEASTGMAATTSATTTAKDATERLTGAQHNNRAVTEAMVIVHEALSGRFSRMGGSLMILTQQLGYASLAMQGLTAAMIVGVMTAGHLIEKLHELKIARDLVQSGRAAFNPIIPDEEADNLRKQIVAISGVSTEMSGQVGNAFMRMENIAVPTMRAMAAALQPVSSAMGKTVPEAAAAMTTAMDAPTQHGRRFLESMHGTTAELAAFDAAMAKNSPLEARTVLLQRITQISRDVEQATNTTTHATEQARSAQERAAQTALRYADSHTFAGRMAAAAANDTLAATDRARGATSRYGEAVAALTNEERQNARGTTWLKDKEDALRHAQLVALQTAEQSHKTTLQSNAAELQATRDYWANLLAGEIKSADDRRVVKEKLEQAEIALLRSKIRVEVAGAKQGYEAQVAAFDQQIEAARGNFAQMVMLEQEKVDFIRKAKGEQSREYSNALKSQDEALTSAIDREISRMQQAARTEMEIRKAGLDEQVALRQISKADEQRILQQFLSDEHAAEMQRLNEYIAQLGQETNAYAQAKQKQEQLERQFNATLQQLHAREVEDAERASERIARDYMQAFSGVESAGKRALGDLLMGTTTWGKATAAVLKSVAEGFIDLGLKMASRWMATQVAMTMTTATQEKVRLAIESGGSGWDAIFSALLGKRVANEGAQTAAVGAGAAARTAIETSASAMTMAVKAAEKATTIGSDAAQAAAGAYKAVVGIPIIGPILAPIAAGVAFAAVSAFGSHAEGAWEIPTDHIAQIHKGEMIIPQRFAAAIRDGGGGFGGGHTIVVNAAIHTPDAATFVGKLKDHGRALAGIVSHEFRHNPSLRPAY